MTKRVYSIQINTDDGVFQIVGINNASIELNEEAHTLRATTRYGDKNLGEVMLEKTFTINGDYKNLILIK